MGLLRIRRLTSPDCFRVEALDTDDTMPETFSLQYPLNQRKKSKRLLKETSTHSSLGKFSKALDHVPKELKSDANDKQLKAAFESAKSVSILMTGKTGSGKSTLACEWHR